MEKVRRESETFLEKVFNKHDKRHSGFIKSQSMSEILTSLNQDLVFEDNEVKEMVGFYDPKGTGLLDLDAFNQICMHFLLRQKRRDSQVFGGVKEVTLNVFDEP